MWRETSVTSCLKRSFHLAGLWAVNRTCVINDRSFSPRLSTPFSSPRYYIYRLIEGSEKRSRYSGHSIGSDETRGNGTPLESFVWSWIEVRHIRDICNRMDNGTLTTHHARQTNNTFVEVFDV